MHVTYYIEYVVVNELLSVEVVSPPLKQHTNERKWNNPIDVMHTLSLYRRCYYILWRDDGISGSYRQPSIAGIWRKEKTGEERK